MENKNTRRNFIIKTSSLLAVLTTIPFVKKVKASFSPKNNTIKVDISTIPEGEAIVIDWNKQPVFIRHRTPAEIELAKNTKNEELIDIETDEQRTIDPKWLVVIGNCTHKGCLVEGNKPNDSRGDFGGWLCPCHKSHFDVSGRIRKGPAQKNLVVPPYRFIDDGFIEIGVSS